MVIYESYATPMSMRVLHSVTERLISDIVMKCPRKWLLNLNTSDTTNQRCYKPRTPCIDHQNRCSHGITTIYHNQIHNFKVFQSLKLFRFLFLVQKVDEAVSLFFIFMLEPVAPLARPSIPSYRAIFKIREYRNPGFEGVSEFRVVSLPIFGPKS